MIAEVAGEAEFAQYREYAHGAIDRSRRSKRAAIDEAQDWLDGRTEFHAPLVDRAARFERSRIVNRRMASALGALSVLLVAASFTLLTLTDWEYGLEQARLVGTGVVVSVAFGVAVMTSRAARQDAFAAEQEVRNSAYQAQRQAQAILHDRILTEFSLALQDELVARGMVRFPVRAPRLVESAPDTPIESPSIERVIRFVANHETSAIGVSGPRGVGKSTLLRAVASDVRSSGGIAAVVAAPVEYSPTDLLRSIPFELHRHFRIEPPPPHRPRRRTAEWVGVAMTIAGLVAILHLSFPSLFLNAWIVIKPALLPVTGFILIVSGLFLAIRPKGHVEDEDAALRGLRTLVRDLEYETTNAGEVSARGLPLGEVSFSRSVARRSLSHADIAVNLRRALESISDGGERRVMIAVDELDKLPTATAAVRTINTLKDIMRVSGVHVLVTVSDEALASFALGSFERDAFDSTFDAVFDVERLSLAGANHLISSRVVGFPEKLVALCLVSAAGLARDLIRQARALIDKASQVDPMPPWADVARSLVFSQAQEAISAYARTGADLSQIPRWTAAFEALKKLHGQQGWGSAPPVEFGDELATHYSRAVILLRTIDWLVGTTSDDIAPTVEQLRDTVQLASRRGGAAIALQNLSSLRL